jgi:archaellum component FlaC
MDENNEILTAVKQGFERIDQRLGRIEGDMSGLTTDVSGVRTDVSGLKTDVSGLKTDVSDLKTDVSGLKTGMSGLRTQVSALSNDVGKVQMKLEFLIDKADLIKENVVDLRTRMTRYDTEVEHPLEQRVTHLEARVSILEKKK